MPSSTGWSVDSTLIEREFDGARQRIVGLSHPSYPMEVNSSKTDMEEVVALAHGTYLRAVWDTLGIPPAWIPSTSSVFRIMEHSTSLRLNLLPLSSGDPRMSVQVKRHEIEGDGTKGTLLDRTLSLFSLLGFPSANAGSPPDLARNQMGLRVQMRIARKGTGWAAQVTGCMVSARLVPEAHHLVANLPLLRDFRLLVRNQPPAEVQQMLNAIGASSGNGQGDTFIDGVGVPMGPEAGFVFNGHVRKGAPSQANQGRPSALAHGMSLRWNLIYERRHTVRDPFLAHATASMVRRYDLFATDLPRRLADPPSQVGRQAAEGARASREPARLQPFRRPIRLYLKGAELEDRRGRFKVMQSRLADRGANEDQVQAAPAQPASARSNAFAAVSAYRQSQTMFNTIDAVGLDWNDFFRFAQSPLLVRFRAGMLQGPGKGGKTVNAQVDFEPPRIVFSEPWNAKLRQPLSVRYALADLTRSRSSREPLGLAADPRWSWHEFAHVLLAGATSRLELPFAHSMGDALAAILCDPTSELARDTSERAMRGITFAWAYLSRRHDRDPRLGWSWSGTYHRAAQFSYPPCNCRRKGYDSEQILSSTLFRLYRCLGGDTTLVPFTPNEPSDPDVVARASAAHYVAYLLMRSVALMGASNAVPIETAQQFVTLLQSADQATRPAATGAIHGRTGGCAHKLIRWAFEAQGMYAGVTDEEVHDGPGLPPEVDLFIDDRRPDAPAAAARGGYMPVSLHWEDDVARPVPLWHAAPAAVWMVDRSVHVRVQNRGRRDALDARVRVSWIRLQGGASPPPWDAGWTHAPLSAPADIPAGGAVDFMLADVLPDRLRSYVVLVQASSPDDLANTDAATALPCVKGAPLIDLVAGDNNLGLVVVPPP